MVSKERPHLLIVAALDDEFEPLRLILKARRLPKSARQAQRYYSSSVRTRHGQLYKVILTVAAKGERFTSAILHGAIEKWRPYYVVLTGIAATLPGETRRLGHILVADRIVDLSEKKQWPGKSELRPDPVPCEDELVREIRDFRKRRRLEKTVHVGPLISQTDLVKSAKFRNWLAEAAARAVGAKPIGLEMEGGGVAAAARTQHVRNRPGIIVIKGAVDFASYFKNDAARRRASVGAAKFVREFLVDGPIGVDRRRRGRTAGTLQPPLTSSGVAGSVQLEQVVEIARETRSWLKPHVLPPIARAKAERYCVSSLRAAFDAESACVLGIVGQAGYGKTTVLGAVYDKLVERGIPWTLLIRCSDLEPDELDSPNGLSMELGRAASRASIPISDVVQQLTASWGRGAVLLDTLDLILDTKLVLRLRYLLRDLMKSRCLVAFTCRDFEYDTYLNPVNKRLPDIGPHYDHYWVTQFSDSEAKEAILAYLEKEHQAVPERDREAFTSRLLGLSADYRPLRDITHNPLLLAMLCELFGVERQVPADLTVSALYNLYWMDKIATSRRSAEIPRLGPAKEYLCLRMAKAIFKASSERLRESLYRSDVVDPSDEISHIAWADLLSEGVIQQAFPLSNARFFHQTLLEYAIARWLATIEGESHRDELIRRATRQMQGQLRLQWWPVIRQFVSFADLEDVDRLSHQLDLTRLDAFRSFSLGLAARQGPLIRGDLLPVALQNGTEHQRVLLQAAESLAPKDPKTAWTIAVCLLREGNMAVASEAAKAIGYFVDRLGSDRSRSIEEVFSAIEERFIGTSRKPAGQDQAGTLLGWVMESCVPVVAENRDYATLRLFRTRYASLGQKSRRSIVRLHEEPYVPSKDVAELVSVMLSEPLPKIFHPHAVKLVARLLVDSKTDSTVRDSVDRWYAGKGNLPVGWAPVLEGASGRASVGDPSLIRNLVRRAFTGRTEVGDNVVVPILQAIEGGAAEVVLDAMLDVDLEEVRETRISVISAVLRHVAATTAGAPSARVLTWLGPVAASHPEPVLPGIAAFVGRSSALDRYLIALLEKVPIRKRARYIIDVTREAKGRLDPDFASQLELLLPKPLLDATAYVALIRLLAVQAVTRIDAVPRMLELALYRSDPVALEASRHLRELARTRSGPSVAQLNQLGKSLIVGVRMNWLAGVEAATSSMTPSDTDLLEMASLLQSEDSEPVVQAFRSLVIRLRDLFPRFPAELGRRLLELSVRWAIREGLPGGVRRSGLAILRAVADRADDDLLRRVESAALEVLKCVDVRKLTDGEIQTINLVSAVARKSAPFLMRILDLGPAVQQANWRPVVIAIRRVQGPGSHILDQIMEASWCPTDAKGQILGFRGV